MSQPVIGILTFEDLKQITGYQRRTEVERSLKAQGVKVFRGRVGPWTTVSLINKAGGSEQISHEQYEVDIL